MSGGGSTPARPASRIVALSALAAAAALAILLWRLRGGALVDDAFITFRYAARWASGRGLTWNDGGAPVEGFSNPLWTLLLGSIARTGLPPHAAAPLLGLAAWTGTVGVMLAVARARRLSTAATLLLAGGLAVDVGGGLWAGSGLETSLAGLLVAFWLLGALGEGAGFGRGFLLGILGAGLALARPEGLAWALWGWLWLVWGRWARAPVLLGWWIGFTPVLGYLGFRWITYGGVLPNTFFAKMELGGTPIIHGATDLMGWVAAHAVPILLLIAWFIPARRRSERGVMETGATSWRPPSGPRMALLLPGGVLFVGAVFVLLAGGDWMGRARYLAPTLPAFYLLVAELFDRRRRYGVPARDVLAGCVLAAHLACGWVTRDRIPDYTRAGEVLGKWLAGAAAPGDTVAVSAAGAVPYFSGLPAIDVLGINDPGVRWRPARHTGTWAPGHHRYSVDEILRLRPAWVVWDFGVRVNEHRLREFRDWTGDADALDYRRALLSRPEFRNSYSIERGAPAATQRSYTVYRRR